MKLPLARLKRAVTRRRGQLATATAKGAPKAPPFIENDTRKPLAVLTFVWNEAAYLRKWVSYYGDQVGRDNLFVFVHGGSPEMSALAEGCHIYPLPRDRVDKFFARRKSDLAAGMLSFLLAEYQSVIVGDVDEYVVIDPALGIGLVDYVQTHRQAGQSLKPFNFDLLDTPGAGPLDLDRPVFEQRNQARSRYQFCKPVIVSDRVEFAAGFHYSDHYPVLAEGAFLVHLHFADAAINREIDAARQASFDANPHLAEAHQRSRGFWSRHQARFEDRQRKSAKMPVHDLDDILPAYQTAMRQSVIREPRTKMNAPGWTMTFGAQSETIRIRVPQRFASVF